MHSWPVFPGLKAFPQLSTALRIKSRLLSMVCEAPGVLVPTGLITCTLGLSLLSAETMTLLPLWYPSRYSLC